MKVYLKKRYIILIVLVMIILSVSSLYFGKKIAENNLKGENITLDDKSESDVVSEEMDKIVQTHEIIKEHYIEDIDSEELLEGAIQGMLETLDDPYSTYMDEASMEEFDEQIESSFQGIGAEVSMVNGKVTIVAPIKDSPAEDAGLRPNDQINRIDDESIEGLDLQEAVDKIRGEKGSEVTIEVERPGVSKPFDVSVVRDEIPIETVYSDTETIDGKKTGILEITSFSTETSEEFKTELTKLEDEGIEGLVIDVRGNPGGLLDSVEDMLNEFIPKDVPFLQIEDKEGNKEPHHSKLDEKKDYPVNVIVDEGSASASEILAVALKEVGYDVVGETSFGKGTVQQALPLGDGSTVKLTIFKWLSPEGNWINEKGVEPTVEQKQPAYYYSNPLQFNDPLTYNHTSEEIENTQIMLKGLGYELDREDGFFDKETKKAVESFQKDEDLKVTGEVDEETAEILETKIVDQIREGEDDKQLEKALNSLYK